MEGLRIVSVTGHSPSAACGRCQSTGCPWDRIGEHVVCPDCQELLVVGDADPLVEKLRKNQCAVCNHLGTVRYLTFPLHAREPVEIDLCPRHFHAFIGRRLDRSAFRILSRRLQTLGLSPRQVFLLHEAFYDDRGHPLQPVPDA